MSGVITRTRRIDHAGILKGFTGREYVESYVINPDGIDVGVAVNEVQVVTINGGPSGGDFTLTFDGLTTAVIAWNATGATVETRLEALANVLPADVGVTGSAGGPYTVTWAGQYAAMDPPRLSASSAGLTGGTAPTVSIATSVEGDPSEEGRYIVKAGLVVMLDTDEETVITWDGGTVASILGINGREFELFDTSERSKIDIPVYMQNAVFDKTKIIDYAANEADLLTWAENTGNKFR